MLWWVSLSTWRICGVRTDMRWRFPPPLPPKCDGHNLNQRLSLSPQYWTFKLSTRKEINLFLPCLCLLNFSLSASFCLPSSSFYNPVSPLRCLCWLFLLLCSPPPPVSPFPFLLLYERQVQGSPITRRGLRKLYGLWPRSCHVALLSCRFQVRNSHWLPAQQHQPQSRYHTEETRVQLLMPQWKATSLADLWGRTNVYV